MFDENITNAFFSILALFAALGILYLIVKRMSAKGKLPGFPNNLKIISKLSLQAKTNLFIVKAGEKTLLIGVSGNSISMLADLTDYSNSNLFDTNGKKETISDSDSRGDDFISKLHNANKSTLSFKEFIKTSFKKAN